MRDWDWSTGKQLFVQCLVSEFDFTYGKHYLRRVCYWNNFIEYYFWGVSFLTIIISIFRITPFAYVLQPLMKRPQMCTVLSCC